MTWIDWKNDLLKIDVTWRESVGQYKVTVRKHGSILGTGYCAELSDVDLVYHIEKDDPNLIKTGGEWA